MFVKSNTVREECDASELGVPLTGMPMSPVEMQMSHFHVGYLFPCPLSNLINDHVTCPYDLCVTKALVTSRVL